MIDPERAVGASLPPIEHSWDEKDVILYNLGLGAGDPPGDPAELAWTYERGLKVLPTLVVTQSLSILAGLKDVPGLEFDPAKALHGEQGVTVLEGQLPTSCHAATSGRVAGVYDKGSGALIIVETETQAAFGNVLARSRFALFMLGAGGFGGNAKSPQPRTAPEREPDAELSRRILPQQALIFRLSGDMNPLHVDEAAARHAGFERPILHGLATYGVACRAVVDDLLGGDAGALESFDARFSGVVYPGETVTLQTWREDGRIALEARSLERGVRVISGGEIVLRG